MISTPNSQGPSEGRLSPEWGGGIWQLLLHFLPTQQVEWSVCAEWGAQQPLPPSLCTHITSLPPGEGSAPTQDGESQRTGFLLCRGSEASSCPHPSSKHRQSPSTVYPQKPTETPLVCGGENVRQNPINCLFLKGAILPIPQG